MKLHLFFRTLASRVKVFFDFIWNNLQFSDLSRNRARLGLIIIAAILIFGIGLFEPIGVHPWTDTGLGVLVSAIFAFLIGTGFLLAIRIIIMIPRFFRDWGILLTGAIVGYLTFMFPTPYGMLFGWVVVVFESLFFTGLLFWIFGDHTDASRRMRVWMVLATAIGLFFNAWTIYWLMDRGDDTYLVDQAQVKTGMVEQLEAEDPGRKGDDAVEHLSYGSRNTRNRPEYGEKADLITSTVDGSDFVGSQGGFKMKLRRLLLGFDPEHLPVNGLVWYPQGDGPFPLVLMVHGNHNLAEHSDPGYAYLGRHLASKGYIAVSVDENFFNGSFIGGLNGENDARGWMLLQHLGQWHQWNQCDTNLFFNRVDTSRIALMGHSRGGEAAAIAGHFNRLPYYPDDATVDFDFHYAIRSIIAIAPSDGQYSPAGQENELKEISYLLLQGAHDADVSSYMGMRQYLRTRFTQSAGFKASVYSYRSNHGQFNTVWGNTDYGWPASLFLNKKPLLTPEEQRELAKVYITGFLEATLWDRKEYIPMFRDHRTIENWLPDDIYITRYEDPSFIALCTFEEDVDVTTGSVPGVSIRSEHLSLWKENKQGFRSNWDKDNNTVTLGWKGDSRLASYTIEVAADFYKNHSLDSNSCLAFSAANTREELPEEEPDHCEEEPGPSRDTVEIAVKENPVQVDFSIRLKDAEGDSVSLPLSRFAHIPPVLESEFLKLKIANNRYGSKYEVTLQDFALPMRNFMNENRRFDPSRLRSVTFVFDQTRKGVLVLDRIGFEREPE